MQFLSVSENRLKFLNLRNNVKLEKLWCDDNLLMGLSVLNNKNIKLISCYNNQIKEKEMDRLIKSLPTRSSEENGRFYVVDRRENSTDNNICTIQQVNDAKKKNWDVLKSDGGEFTGH